jgi:hypothetical protein
LNLVDIEILGEMYVSMSNKKQLSQIITDTILPMSLQLETDVQAVTFFSSVWKAFQRGRTFYSESDIKNFALSLSQINELALRKHYIMLSIRILLFQYDSDTAKSIVSQYEQETNHDEQIVKAGKISYLWIEMNEPEKYVNAENELKTLMEG